MTDPSVPVLSKTKYLAGLQCPKLLWVQHHDAACLAGMDGATLYRIEQGHLVGSIAQRLYPTGITIDWELGLEQVVRRSPEALVERRPLFEAGFAFAGAFTRADVLNPVGRRQWDLIEVKSATTIKPIHLEDVAFQYHVYGGAGLSLRRCYVALVDSSYLFQGELDPTQLFRLVDVTQDIQPLVPRVARRIQRQLELLENRTCPAAAVGRRCSTPFACPLTEECWSFLPPQNVFSLRRGGDRSWQLLAKGVLRLREIPTQFPLSPTHCIQVHCARTGRAHLDRSALRRFLHRFSYPLYFLDFETAAIAVPRWHFSRPYEQVPFQYSLHVQQRPGDPPRQCSFLAKGKDDPRPRLLARLKRQLGQQGSIVAHHASFEKQVLLGCAEHFPEHRGWISAALSRLIDLEEPFRRFYYYHPHQEGSTSLKTIAPVVAGEGYEDLEIADGQSAAQRFLHAELGSCTQTERSAIREALRRYCCRDTEVMVQILERLFHLARSVSLSAKAACREHPPLFEKEKK